MNDFLTYLNQLTEPETLWPACIEQRKACDPFYKQILALTSPDFLDDLLLAQGRVAEEQEREAFSRGFRLGAQAMLAAFTSPPVERP